VGRDSGCWNADYHLRAFRTVEPVVFFCGRHAGCTGGSDTGSGVSAAIVGRQRCTDDVAVAAGVRTRLVSAAVEPFYATRGIDRRLAKHAA
jgi:hypothetical protein